MVISVTVMIISLASFCDRAHRREAVVVVVAARVPGRQLPPERGRPVEHDVALGEKPGPQHDGGEHVVTGVEVRQPEVEADELSARGDDERPRPLIETLRSARRPAQEDRAGSHGRRHHSSVDLDLSSEVDRTRGACASRRGLRRPIPRTSGPRSAVRACGSSRSATRRTTGPRSTGAETSGGRPRSWRRRAARSPSSIGLT